MEYQQWSKEEIVYYQRITGINGHKISEFYRRAGIPSNDPAKRAELLSKRLGLTAIDQEVLARAQGRPMALMTLEIMMDLKLKENIQ